LNNEPRSLLTPECLIFQFLALFVMKASGSKSRSGTVPIHRFLFLWGQSLRSIHPQ